MDLSGSKTMYEKNLFTICHANVYNSKSQSIVPFVKQSISILRVIHVKFMWDLWRDPRESMPRSQGMCETIAR